LELPSEARICATCGCYQNAWKNRIKFFATIVAGLSFSLAAVAFLATNLEALRKSLMWSDRVSIFSVSDSESLIVGNVGDGAVYFSHIILSYSKPRKSETNKDTYTEVNFTGHIPVQAKLEPGEIRSVESFESLEDPIDEWIDKKLEEGYELKTVFVENDEENFDKLVEAESYHLGKCVFWMYTTVDSPGFQKVQKHLDGMNLRNNESRYVATLEVEATAYLYSISKGDKLVQPVHIFAYLLEWTGKECVGS